ncbi:hypothetical protein PO909_027950 [Leuciscus waleckii]
MEGDSVTLNSGVTEVQRSDYIEWRFNSILIAKANIPQYGKEERFRDRLKLDRTGSLTITNTRTTDSGLYKLSIIVGDKEIIKRFSVTVYATTTLTLQSDQQTPSPPPVSVSLIVPISSAVAGSLMILAGFGIFWICRKHRKTDNEVQTRDEEVTYADPKFYKRKAQTAVRQFLLEFTLSKLRLLMALPSPPTACQRPFLPASNSAFKRLAIQTQPRRLG